MRIRERVGGLAVVGTRCCSEVRSIKGELNWDGRWKDVRWLHRYRAWSRAPSKRSVGTSTDVECRRMRSWRVRPCCCFTPISFFASTVKRTRRSCPIIIQHQLGFLLEQIRRCVGVGRVVVPLRDLVFILLPSRQTSAEPFLPSHPENPGNRSCYNSDCDHTCNDDTQNDGDVEDGGARVVGISDWCRDAG